MTREDGAPSGRASDAVIAELREWVLSRPEHVRAVMERFPPAAYVVAREGRELMCPAPGQRGMVERYLEHDDGSVSLGIVPMETDAAGPFGVLAFLLGNGYAECDPDWLEVVDSQEQFDLYRTAVGGAS